MRKASLFALLAVVLAVSAGAEDRHQSYISYDDGGTVVRTGDRDVEATRNLPVYPGDEIVTARRGRSEVHLSDGNIIGIDRSTAIYFRSILDSYEGESNETVVELRYGKVAVHRTDIGREHVRLDTDQASYVATDEAVYSVESDSRGRDRVTVLDGSVEIRTPQRSTRLRRGETASVDSEGVYDLVADRGYAADDFERWFLKRAERYGSYETRYTDRRVGYWSEDLDSHGRWVFVTGIGWSWRPFVAVGWRPYHNGYWYTSRSGCLTWVSHDPWGWAPWHYGRWGWDPGYGWIWVPGRGYSPAWVYWMYGSGYVGWAPAGWWDCYRPYYGWAYGPYRRAGWDFGFGFDGRVRVNEIDLRPWTFVDGNTLFTNRVDRAALTTDVIKNRLARGGGGLATVSAKPARFTREEVRDPAEAIRRRGLGGDNSGATGVSTDLTPFIRRDAELGSSVRERIVRSRPGEGTVSRGGPGTTPGSGTISRPTEPARGAIGRGIPATEPAERRRDPVRIIGREAEGEPGTTWRDRISRGGDRGENETPSTSRPATTPAPVVVPRESGDSWRNRRSGGSGEAPSRGGDVPARVIDRIGGARVVPRTRDEGGSSGSGSSTRRRDSGDSPDRGSSRGSGSTSRGSSGGSSSGSSSGGGNINRGGSSGGSSTPSGSRDSGSRDGGGSGGSGGSRESGGRIKRDN